MGRLEGQCAKINVWREVKIDGGEARQISCFSEVETILIKITHISLSGHVSAPSDKKAQGIIHRLLLGRGFGIVLSCPIFAPQTVKSFGTIYTMCFLLLTCKVFGFQWAWWMLILLYKLLPAIFHNSLFPQACHQCTHEAKHPVLLYVIITKPVLLCWVTSRVRPSNTGQKSENTALVLW